MKTLHKITATPHPQGNCIRLQWQSPPDATSVQIIRNPHSYPIDPRDGIAIVPASQVAGLESWDDSNLQGETIYYYSLFFNEQQIPDPQYRITAMATEPYDSAGQMLEMLPAIYHRYDNESKHLQRFLELPGEQLDQFYSFASALLNVCDLDRVDGRLLPLLADWIGWQTNTRLEITKQRNEIRYAPYLYQTIGAIPNLEATVKRILGWESRTKEFVHNVFLSNSPEKLTIWQRRIKSDNTVSLESISLDFAYEGRLAAAQDAAGTVWLFYHTLKHDRWEIWYKTLSNGIWAVSQPLIQDRAAIDEIHRYPTVAFQGNQRYVFWNCYNQSRWQIKYHTEVTQNWSDVEPFQKSAVDRRYPWAIADGSGLWLFWVEFDASQQTLKYAYYNGTAWQTPVVFPPDQGQDPKATNDVTAVLVNQKLWVFWARQTDNARWKIAYRVKNNLDPNNHDWGAVQILPSGGDGDDREPSAIVNQGGKLELFWNSNRSGSGSIWCAVLDNPDSQTWSAPEQVTKTPYTDRAPLAIQQNGEIRLLYRSNQSQSYTSQSYNATDTTDFRHVGSTSVDTRNLAKQGLRESFDEFQTYTIVANSRGQPQREANWVGWYAWYAHPGTVGLYLTPTTEDPDLTARDQELLKNILPQFLPIQVKVEFFLQPLEKGEIYDTITSVGEDLIQNIGAFSTEEIYPDIAELRLDRIPEWHLFRAWDAATPNLILHKTVNFATTETPIPTQSRTWHSALTYDEFSD